MKLYEVYLTETFNYKEMFNSVISIAEYLPSKESTDYVERDIDESISWAKKTLKKNDRIVWYLRLLKYNWLDQFNQKSFQNLSTSELTILSQKIEKEMNKITNKFPYVKDSYKFAIQDRQFKIMVEHYLSLPVEKIQSYVWADQTAREILNQFEKYEEEWKEKSGEKAVEIQEGDKLIMSFDNDTKGWWLLNRGACSEEGKAMGHCGNVPSVSYGDRILSFRIKNENDQWTPVLTFILNENGYLGEMKGRGNDKPAKRYHPYIVELLKDTNLIKGIRGGGYMPENNFNINDLDEKQREELISINPELLPFVDMVERFGENSKKVIDNAIFIMDEYLDYERYDSGNQYFIIETYDDAFDLVRVRGDRNIKHVSEFINGNDIFEFSGIDFNDSEIEHFLKYLQDTEKTNGSTTVQRIIEWLQEYDPDTEINDTNWINYIIEERVTEIIELVNLSLQEAMRLAAEKEMFDNFREQIKNYEPNDDNIGKIDFEKINDNGEPDIYENIYFVFEIKDLVTLIKTEGGGEVEEIYGFDLQNIFDNELTIREPYMGWGASGDASEKDALEYFYNNIEYYI